MRRESKTLRVAKAIARTHSPFAKWETRSPEAQGLFVRMARAGMRASVGLARRRQNAPSPRPSGTLPTSLDESARRGQSYSTGGAQ